VGGRFSLSSAIALPLIIGIGGDPFMEFLRGMHQMDRHFRKTPMQDNIPVLMGLLTFWYTTFMGASTHAVLPYDHYLSLFPAFLQQGEMESNGKNVDRQGRPVPYATAPITWGAPGTNGQHAFFQLLHQGTHLVPCDFIGFIHSLNPLGDHHDKLMANFFAQTESLAFGRQTPDEGDFVQKFRQFPGNRPSTTFLIERLTPFTLGQLVALYEHKIFVLGVLWNVFSFDQWGVELGKEMGNIILPELQGEAEPKLSHHDESTRQLIHFYRLVRSRPLVKEKAQASDHGHDHDHEHG
jgi:glucose-6-phosphate isomerase